MIENQQIKRKRTKPDKPTPHGTNNGYRHYGCRCEDCRTANVKYVREYRQRNQKWFLDYSRETYQKRVEIINEIKLDTGCVDCGYRQHPAALHFDHIPGRGEKLFAISSNKLTNLDLILAEIEKCEVVCANCHAIRTVERGQHDSGEARRGKVRARPI